MDGTDQCPNELAGQVVRDSEPLLYTPWRVVQITKVANGFCLQIGCKTFIAKTWLEASTGLAEYWQDPGQAEKKYTEK